VILNSWWVKKFKKRDKRGKTFFGFLQIFFLKGKNIFLFEKYKIDGAPGGKTGKCPFVLDKRVQI